MPIANISNYDFLLNSVTKTPRMKSLSLGDGYQHRSWDSIRRIKETWDVRFTVMTDTQAQTLEGFLEDASVDGFYWISPEDTVARIYRPTGGWAKEYLHPNLVQVSATLELLFDPAVSSIPGVGSLTLPPNQLNGVVAEPALEEMAFYRYRFNFQFFGGGASVPSFITWTPPTLGGTNDIVQATVGKRGTAFANWGNSRKALNFDGVDDSYDFTTPLPINTAFTLYIVFSVDLSKTHSLIAGIAGDASIRVNGTNKVVIDKTGSYAAITSGTTIVNGAKNQLSLSRSSGAVFNLRVNETADGTVTDTTMTQPYLYIGRLNIEAEAPLDGKIADIFYYNTEHTLAQKQYMEAYFAEAYSI